MNQQHQNSASPVALRVSHGKREDSSAPGTHEASLALWHLASENEINAELAAFLNYRGLDLSDECGAEGEWFHVEAHEHEIAFFVQFSGSYGSHWLRCAPAFTRSLDSMSLVLKSLTHDEMLIYRRALTGRRYDGFDLGEGAVDATAHQRAVAVLKAIEGWRHLASAATGGKVGLR